MSATRMLARLAAAAAVAVTAVFAVAAGSAHAAVGEVRVNLNDLDGRLQVEESDRFRVSLSNRTRTPIGGITLVIDVRLTGLTSDGVRLSGGGAGGLTPQDQGGFVRFISPHTFDLGRRGERTVDYEIQFTQAAPSGEARVTATAFQNQSLLGTDTDSVTVRGGGQPVPTTAPATPTAEPTTEQPTEAPPTIDVGAGPLTGGGDDSPGGGVPVILYVLGAILVAVGGAILWLLLRKNPLLTQGAGVGATSAGPYRPSHAAQTRIFPSAHANPTAVMPAVDPNLPPPVDPHLPPPVDPWGERPDPPPRRPGPSGPGGSGGPGGLRPSGPPSGGFGIGRHGPPDDFDPFQPRR